MTRRLLFLLAVTLASSQVAAATRGYTVTGFDRIRVDGPYDVTVRTGLAPSARATGSTDAIDRISVAVQNSTLVIRPDNSGWGGYPGAATGKVEVAITVADLSAAILAGSGKLAIDRVHGDNLELVLGGAGMVSVGLIDVARLSVMLTGSGGASLAGHADDGRLVVRGAGNVAADGLTIRHAEIVSAGAGTITVTAAETAKVTAAGNGDVTVHGKPDCTVDATGTGTVSCGRPAPR
jgi:hypothetical protein